MLEKNAQTLSENEKLLEFRAENRADFTHELSVHEDVFILQANNGTTQLGIGASRWGSSSDSGTTPKELAQFNSGEVAYLL